MPKTSLGKPKVGECRITRKGGITYVYERTTQYSRKLHKTVTLSTRLLGKILPGTTEVVATRPRGAKGCRLQGAGARRVHVGLTSILEWAGRESGIDADLRSSLRAGEAEKVLSIARYWLGTGGHALTRMEGWQLTHELPYAFGVSEDVCGDLFKSLGTNEEPSSAISWHAPPGCPRSRSSPTTPPRYPCIPRTSWKPGVASTRSMTDGMRSSC